MNYNWLKVKEIFVAALQEEVATRSHFINQKCAGDKPLLREVESLLEYYGNTDSFMETPAVAEVADDFAIETDKLKEGDFLKHYRIINKIGQGGMGEVYLAQDTKLGRNVAVKILGDYLGNNKNNLRRFINEAQTASSLNHPNIVVIHEIDEKDGLNFIVNEYIQGLTLTEILGQQKLTLSQICDISIQVANALVAAHKVGVIHRDIKTDNIMVRNDGIVKVLDFGLAKLVEKDKKRTDLNAKINEFMTTRAGMIMGTVAYMSPEQARGNDVDSRTDIWSFGVLLYQLLTCKLPFQGDTTSDIIASILKSDPLPMTESAPIVPKKLEIIARKALMKNPSERFQNIGDVLEELNIFKRGLELGGKTEPLKFRASEKFRQDKTTDLRTNKITVENGKDSDSSQNRSFIGRTFSKIYRPSPVPLYALITCAILVVAGYFGWSNLSSFFTKFDSFQNMRLTKLTFDGLTMRWTTVSPDGKYLGYVLLNDGSPKLMIRQTVTSATAELVPAADVDYLSLSFSPDSNFVYYVSKKKNGVGELYKIPVLGGRSEKILDNISIGVTFSPNGKKMAFIRDRKHLMIAESNGESVQMLTSPDSTDSKLQIDWNPNGKTIICASTSGNSRYYFSEISVADGTEKRLQTQEWMIISSLQWIADGSGLIFTGRDADTKFSQIWKMSYPSLEIKRITNDFSGYFDASLPSDNKSIFAVKSERAYNLWVVGENSTPKKITNTEGLDEGTAGIRWTPDGKIIYSVRSTMKHDLWIVDADGSNNHQLISSEGASSNAFPTVSPDGKFFAFVSDRSGNNDIWRADIDGKNQSQLTNSPFYESWSDISPDGKFLLYEKMDAKKNLTIWKTNLDGLSTSQITKTETDRPVISPDGKFFACAFGKPTSDNPAKLAIFSTDGGEPIKVLDLPKVIDSRIYRWTADGKSLLYVESHNHIFNIWSQSLDMSPPKQITFFDSSEIEKFDYSIKTQNFVLSRGKETSDIVMISDFK
jgi:serine/threonine protein kinase